jgi:hypothetical protein
MALLPQAAGTDPVLRLQQAVTQFEATSLAFEAQARKFETNAEGFENIFIEPDNGSYRLFAAFDKVNLYGATYTTDIEFAMTESRLASRVPQKSFDAIAFSSNQFHAEIAPLGSIEVGWSQRPGKLPRRIALTVDSLFSLVINGTPQGNYLLRLEVVPVIDQASSTIKLVQVLAPRYCLPDGTPFELLQRIPREKNIREDVRTKINEAVKTFIDSVLLAVPAPPQSLDYAVVPHTCRVLHDFISFSARVLPMRRTQGMLITHVNAGFPESVRIAKDLLGRDLGQKIAAFGVGLAGFWLGWGQLVFDADKHSEEGKCWVDVIVDVYPRYDVRLVSDIPGRLLAFAEMRGEPGYNIQMDNCWPFCGKTQREVEDRIRAEISNYRHQALPFADLRGYAIQIQGDFDPFGVLIMLEPM